MATPKDVESDAEDMDVEVEASEVKNSKQPSGGQPPTGGSESRKDPTEKDSETSKPEPIELGKILDRKS